MPIYDMKCPHCNTRRMDVFVHYYDDNVKCKRCGALMKKLISSSGRFIGIKCFPAQGIFLENVSATGKRFYSEKEMRDHERKTGDTITMLH